MELDSKNASTHSDRKAGPSRLMYPPCEQAGLGQHQPGQKKTRQLDVVQHEWGVFVSCMESNDCVLHKVAHLRLITHVEAHYLGEDFTYAT